MSIANQKLESGKQLRPLKLINWVIKMFLRSSNLLKALYLQNSYFNLR